MSAALTSHPLLLAIECATREASVALVRTTEHGVIAERVAERRAVSGSHHAASLLPEIDALLAQAGCVLAEVAAFAVGVGPGAFTSLRIGIATVKGLAFGTDRPVAAVSTLAAVCEAARTSELSQGKVAGVLAAVLDAHRGEVYAAEFGADTPSDGEPRVGEGVYRADQLAELLSPGCTLTGELPAGLIEALRAAGRDDLRAADVSGRAASAGEAGLEIRPSLPRAVAVAGLGARALARGEGVEAAALAPRYLRRAEAEELRLARSR